MYKSLIILLLLLSIGYNAAAQQEYEVNLEDREEAVAMTEKGIRKIEAGNYPGAIKDLEAAIAIDATFHPAYVNLYTAYAQLEGNKSNLIQLLKKGNSIFEEDDELTYYLGYVYYQNHQFSEAINEFTKAIRYSKINGEDFPLVYGYHFNRGNAYLKTKNFQKAITDYTYALKLNPNNPDILTNRGIAYYQHNRKEDACIDWNKSMAEGGFTAEKYLKQFCK